MQGSTLKICQTEQFSSLNVNGNHQGVIGTATAGTTTTIDYKLLDDAFLVGGILLTKGATFGDSVTFQVIDIDNVIGYGANVVLGQYISNWYMREDSQSQVNEISSYPAKVLANLYLRIRYTSIGGSNVSVAVNYRLQKALF